ncbi:MAG: S41 family peptidase [Candidatus Krumholzibacteria bacterium]|nr:S41 family peptidase [Candidatus Krumholzibacteria bacterium]
MKLNKKAIIGLLLLCTVVAVALFVMAGDREEKQRETVYQNLEQFGAVLDRILNYYVDEIDAEKLIRAAIDGMLMQLDEHSIYMDSYEYDNLMISTKGEFGGLGITLGQIAGYPTVVSTLEDTPAYRLGIQGGDKIVEIEGVSTKDWKTEQAVTKLRGREGTQVVLTITREGLADSLHYTITREIIRVPSITYSTDLDGVGYVRVASFAERTASELDAIIRDLEKQKVKGLIIDMRSNPGGLLESAREVCELFLEKDKLLVYTESRIPSHNVKYYSRSTKVHDQVPIVVLINRYSASAAEIVAGALQDWDRAVLVGETSYGKGSVQTVFMIGKDALKLTTAKYFTPSGRCIHKDRPRSEENPDIEVREAAPVEEKKVESPRQEFHTSGGRIVYGGGGITPDWTITLPDLTEFEVDLERRNLFFNFAVHYAAQNRVSDTFEVGDAVIADFRAYCAESKFTAPDSAWTAPEDVDYMKLAIKREVFRRLMGVKGAYLATLPKDEEVNKVLSMFRAAPTLKQMFEYAGEQTKPAEAAKKTTEAPKK